MTFAFLRRTTGAMILGLVLVTASVLPSFAATVVTVNGIAISDTQVDQRLRLFRMEGNNTGRKGATDQLITEAIQMSEAKRLGVAVSNAQVDEALLQIARNLKVSQDKLIQMLSQGGVSSDTLRDRLRAAIAWNAVTQRAVVPNVQISDLELDQKAAARVSDYQKFDYILKEIVFVGQGASGRTAQANRYRSSFTGCDSAVQLSLGFTDAAVVDIGRRHATQLPEAMAKELAGMNVGGITKPRVVESGVSMLAICEKTQAEDLTFMKDDLRAEVGGSNLEKEAQAYLTRLRNSAKIIYN
ncbi:SurA N-terminal domain-containing protein [Devosia sp.]|uniref:peptidylprolyl isomerase n=1 Tax=Devosia sp. TaxID=1871048 RepID=UPI001AD1FB28|nr:SurA N-terminal domain-containing protein [Devosia sp.]MBN9336166.1 SurA N-terminal domain-containing protein [Devosia sp.]